MYRERVRAGIALLNEKVEGWRDRIDLSTLDMQLCTSCIVGQVFGIEAGSDRGWSQFAEINTDILGIADPMDFGFDADNGDDEEYAELQDAWTAELRLTV